MNDRKNSLIENAFGWVVGIPIALVFLILCSPIILYVVLVQGNILVFRKKRFLKRNAGKLILCVSPGRKFQVFLSAHRDEILSLGVNDIVIFDPTKSNNQYDSFEWNTMISSGSGLPLLLKIENNTIEQHSFKTDFLAYFRKEIDWIQLRGSIKRKVDGKNY